jgi:hypothetical protein
MITLITRRAFLLASSTLLVARRWPMAALSRAKFSVALAAKTPKSTYLVGERIVINMSLTNTGPDTVRVSERLDGTIRITSLTVNGVPAPTRTVGIQYDDDLATQLKQSLVTLAPGQARALPPWRSARDRVFAAQALETIQFDPAGQHGGRSHAVGQPGTYVLTVVYQLDPSLDDGLSPPVAVEVSTPATVTFVVT